MMETVEIALCAGVLIVAFLYSSVGHAGASGYIAVMALAGISATIIKPTALVLNVVVATIGSIQFWRAGHFRWSLFWPFALFSMPAAYYGGLLKVPTELLKIAIGCVLLASALRLLIQIRPATEFRPMKRPVALATGGVLGFLAGLTGTGGGIFLTPLMILMRWAPTKQVAAVSIVYILVNSVSGLLGALHSWWLSSQLSWPEFASGLPRALMTLIKHDVPFLVPMILCVIVSGSLGSYLGSRRFPVLVIHVLLAAVLILAGVKLIFTKAGEPPRPKSSAAATISHL